MKRFLHAIAFGIVLQLLAGTSSLSARNIDGRLYFGAAGGYNTTWGGFYGGDLEASASIGRNFECGLNLETLSSGVTAAGLRLQPQICFSKSKLYLETRLLGRMYAVDNIADVTANAALGWGNRHFDVAIGAFYRVVTPLEGQYQLHHEPLDLTYRFEYKVMGDESRWDLSLGFANSHPYWIERLSVPHCFLKGRFDVSKHFSVVGRLDYQQAGFMHIVSNFYGVQGRLGLSYNF